MARHDIGEWAFKHGHKANGKISPEWHTWQTMKKRCFNPKNHKFPGYGGRGITVCPEWRDSFMAFLSDMGLRPGPEYSIDRIDNDGNYEPSNCRWATRSQQAMNRRNTSFLTFNGETLTQMQWAGRLGLPYQRIANRILQLGWSVERALSTPVGKYAKGELAL